MLLAEKNRVYGKTKELDVIMGKQKSWMSLH